MHKDYNLQPVEDLCNHKAVITTISELIKDKANIFGL